jgi:fumarylacetoacetase
MSDETLSFQRESWIDVAADSDFPIQNLPLGVVASFGEPHAATIVGNTIVDLYALSKAGLLDAVPDAELLQRPALNAFLARGRAAGTRLRRRLSDLLRRDGDPALREGATHAFLFEHERVASLVPVDVGDYVDFYSSLEHATNLGKLFRPGGDPLLPNWRWIPIGYHGRSATIQIDGQPVVRPNGQRKAPDAQAPGFGPSTMLDIELEVGFVTGQGNAPSTPIPVDQAEQHIAGIVLVNDWSARDIQAWEYQPLGPFLGKSFATTISPWIVSLDALEPFRVTGPVQTPPPLDYLSATASSAFDIQLSIELQTAKMRESGKTPRRISRTTFAAMYWSMAQQLAHATVNGARTRAGDLFASGTISGTSPDSYGSLIELAWRGERPIDLGNGETRAFLQDGDEVVLRGWCEKPGARRIGFGTARGTILGAPPMNAPPTVP